MFDLALKNIFRQKTRTTLTVIGIVIGIGAIVALGSISEGINNMISRELEFVAGTITITLKEGGGLMGYGGEIEKPVADDLEQISGVKEVIPMAIKIGAIVPMHGIEHVIVGMDPEWQEYFEGRGIGIESGRMLEAGDEYVALLGYRYADESMLTPGDTLELEDEDFEVVGVLEEMGTEDDTMVILPIDTMMDVYELDNYNSIIVIPEDITKVDSLAEEIEETFEDLNALTAKEIAKQTGDIVNSIRIFTLGIASVAAIVGGLGVMNTMIMSVLERRREIGIMKAIGATSRFVLTQILMESMLISLIGGLAGVFIGWLGSLSLGMLSGGMAYAEVTPQLIVGSLTFALALGAVGGVYPAWQAAKLDPIEALRYE